MAAVATTAKITIGEIDYDLPKLTFKRIKRVWPIIEEIQKTDFLNTDVDDLSGMMEQFGLFDKVIIIFSVALGDPEMTPEWIEERLLANEMVGLQQSMTDLLIHSGLAVRTEEGALEGEAGAAPAASSTETGTA